MPRLDNSSHTVVAIRQVFVVLVLSLRVLPSVGFPTRMFMAMNKNCNSGRLCRAMNDQFVSLGNAIDS